MFFVLLLCLIYFVSTSANPTDSKKFQNALNQQNFQTVLQSIEDRLRNLDKIYTAQYSPSIEGKLDEYARKLNLIDGKLSRFEYVMHVEFDKISQNISNQGFKSDINSDYMNRKIDADYEKINHRLVLVEMKLEMQERKILDKFELMMKRFEKLDEYLTTREGDIEVEIADVLAVVDDIKLTCMTLDVDNITKSINVTNYNIESIKTNLNSANNKFEENFSKLHDIVEINLNNINKSMHQISRKGDKIKQELSEYNNVMKMYDSTSDKYNIRSVENILNETRNEQQNGFRNLIVQVGRLKEKSTILSDPNSESMQLVEKIDSNFKDVIEAQKYFLESCHRLQMDEPQLENKIGEVLEKLIDIFERKTSVELKDIQKLEQIIKTHDVSIRRNTYSMSNNLGVLVHKVHENKEEIKDYLMGIKDLSKNLSLHLEHFERNTTFDVSQIITSIKKQQTQLNKIDEDANNQHHQTKINFFETNNQIKQINNLTSINNIKTILNKIETKFDTYINETKSESLTFTKLLEILQINSTNKENELDLAIQEVFGDNTNKSNVKIPNCLDLDIDVRNSFNKSNKCIYNTSSLEDNISINEITNDCLNLDIDVRNSFNNTEKCNKTNKMQEPNQIKFEEIVIDCIDIDIDVRNGFNSSIKCKQINKNASEEIKFEEVVTINCTDIDIDVRNSFNSSIKCMNQSNINIKEASQISFGDDFINCTDIDIDVRSAFNSTHKCFMNKSVDLNETINDSITFSTNNTNLIKINITEDRRNNNLEGIGINCDGLSGVNCTQTGIDVRNNFNTTGNELLRTINQENQFIKNDSQPLMALKYNINKSVDDTDGIINKINNTNDYEYFEVITNKSNLLEEITSYDETIDLE